MKVLYITPFGLSTNSGGERHCYANLRSICCYPEVVVDYIGPRFDHTLPGIERGRFRNVWARNYKFSDKVSAAMHFSSTSLIGLFDEFKNVIDSEYDIVFVESTRCGFISKYVKSSRTVCNIHNIETDFLSINATGATKLAAYNAKRSEIQTAKTCKHFLVMHEADKARFEDIYSLGKLAKSFHYHPVCSFPAPHEPVPYYDRDKVIMFCGSLSSLYNEQGLMEFVKECWPSLSDEGFTLRVAGRNPSPRLMAFLSNYKDVQLFSNPPDMQLLLSKARLLILPDMSGTGMKLRVAEAINLGIPVIGTADGLKGYVDIDRFGFSAKDIKSMGPIIYDHISNGEEILSGLSHTTLEVWKEHYSYDVFEQRLHRILTAILTS